MLKAQRPVRRFVWLLQPPTQPELAPLSPSIPLLVHSSTAMLHGLPNYGILPLEMKLLHLLSDTGGS